MSNKLDGKWGYSFDFETFEEAFDTPEQAKDALMTEAIARELNTECKVWIGQYRKPGDPEGYVDADLLLEHSGCQDDYMGDWGDEWPGETKEQNQELTDAIQKVYAEWLDKYDLRPSWGIIEMETIQKFTVGQLMDSVVGLRQPQTSEDLSSSTSPSSE